MAENVKVAVRVRPFNSRENARNAKVIIKMGGKTTEITDLENPSIEPKKFAFDFSYWSHDGFEEKPDGYLAPKNSAYADQQVVFDDLGRGVLDNAWKGYNCSLFAYGQTGSGKSYSMVGYGVNKGIVPITCEELFKAIELKRKDAKKDEEYQVSVSMLEIYNEQVRDLLNPKSNVKGGLKVRQHPSKGFYVDNLVTAAVGSYAAIDSKINEGTKNRTVAATNMNATSSRAHTIVAINFIQKAANAAGQNMTKTSSINLVDLAGSERADSTGATGDRLKEGSAINQSLSTLGNVIKALADVSTGKKNTMVPYRDSVLTKLLKNALGGNSKTVMIAALSPADINYEETLSTLRFADRAKAIKTQAIVNESPTDKLIRELREENAKLQEMLKKGGVVPGAGGGGGDNTQQSQQEVEEMKREMEETLRRNQEEMEEMKKSWQQRLQEQQADSQVNLDAEKQKHEKRKVIPHFWNLNEDPSLTAMVIHFCNPGMSKVGNKKASPAPEILLNGLSIMTQHAAVNNKDNTVTLTPVSEAKILVNGQAINAETLLHHNDRVMFGSNHLYVFHHPQDMAKNLKAGKKVETPTYDQAQEEIAESTGLMNNIGAKDGGHKSKDDLLLQEDLIHLMPMLSEANAMSEELDKKVKYEIALVSPQARGLKEGRTEVNIKMKNLENGNEWMWDRNKFINRKYLMQEMYQNYVEGDKDWDVETNKDPFWEPADAEIMIGSTHVYLQSLGYLIELEENLSITDFKGNEQGHMSVEVRPCTSEWKDITDDFVENPKDLVGKSLHFKIMIPHVRGLPSKFQKSFCRYKFYLDEQWAQTDEMPGINPDYKHEKKFSFKHVTQQLVDYLVNTPLVVEVWGKQKENKPAGGATDTKSLMQREKTVIDNSKKDDGNNKTTTELNTWKKKAERAEAKLAKIQQLVNNAQKKKEPGVPVVELDKILANTKDPGGPKSEKAKEDTLGKNTSQACHVQ